MANEIFVSYSRSNQRFVDKLTERLQRAKCSPWVDRERIAGGTAWQAEIARAVRTCKAFLIILSRDSVKSKEVQTELSLARELDRRIIPVLYQNATIPDGMSYPLTGKQQVDFAQQPFDKAFEHLAKALNCSPEPSQRSVRKSSAVPVRVRAGKFRTSTVPKILLGQFYGTPKELWGFRNHPVRKSPDEIARKCLKEQAALLRLPGIGNLRPHRVIESVGATHIIFQQRHHGLRIHRAFVSVHIDRKRRVYLVKNRAIPSAFLPRRAKFLITATAARRRALLHINKTVAKGRLLEKSSGAQVDPHRMSFLGREQLWYPVEDQLRPARRVRVLVENPPGEWIVYVDGITGVVLRVHDILKFTKGRAQVFDPNPVAAIGDWRQLIKDGRPLRPPIAAYTTVELHDLSGNGYLDGRRVTTGPTRDRVRRLDHLFLFKNTDKGFDETMVYYHLDRAIHYLESLGYKGARAIFSTPLAVNAHGTSADISWYSPGQGRLTFGTGGVKDAEDGEVILHEFAHALQNRICPDFGQTLESAAMGEGFADYLAASFFAARKAPALRTCVGSWDAIMNADGDPPRIRRVDEPLTYESLDYAPTADAHANGTIWAATLWDIWTALGRDVADRIIIESHFQLDGFTRFCRGARAIIDADANLYDGLHLEVLLNIFHRRGIGPVE